MRHEWKTPARNLAEPERTWTADEAGIWLDGELIGFPEVAREMRRLAAALAEEREHTRFLREQNADLVRQIRSAELYPN